MAGKFEVYTDKAGEHRFRLKAGNGEIILTSEGYNQKDGCANGIESVRKNAANPDQYEKITTDSGKYRFNLKAANHQVIGNSEAYNSKASMENGIKSVMKNGPTTKIVEE